MKPIIPVARQVIRIENFFDGDDGWVVAYAGMPCIGCGTTRESAEEMADNLAFIWSQVAKKCGWTGPELSLLSVEYDCSGGRWTAKAFIRNPLTDYDVEIEGAVGSGDTMEEAREELCDKLDAFIFGEIERVGCRNMMAAQPKVDVDELLRGVLDGMKRSKP